MTERHAVIVEGRTGIGASLVTRLLADGWAVWSVSRETQGHPSGVEVLGWEATGGAPLRRRARRCLHALEDGPGFFFASRSGLLPYGLTSTHGRLITSCRYRLLIKHHGHRSGLLFSRSGSS